MCVCERERERERLTENGQVMELSDPGVNRGRLTTTDWPIVQQSQLFLKVTRACEL